jgi:site-specific recombinase XerD
MSSLRIPARLRCETSENKASRKYTRRVSLEEVPGRQHTGTGRQTTPPVPGPRRRGRLPAPLPARLEPVHAAYTAALGQATMSAETRRTYASKLRQYLAWLDTADAAGDPLTDPDARDRAVRDWRSHLLTVAKQAPATVNTALAAVDDFYTRRGLGQAAAERTRRPTTAPRTLDKRALRRWLRAVETQPSSRDRALASIPFYAGARIAETIRLDTGDVHISARKPALRIHGNRDKIRDIPLHPRLRTHIQQWLAERPDWPDANANPALFLNRRGERLTVRGARDVIARIAQAAGLHDITADVLRSTFAATLARGGTDPVVLADLLGNAGLDTTRRYTKPAANDRSKALHLLPINR